MRTSIENLNATFTAFHMNVNQTFNLLKHIDDECPHGIECIYMNYI